MSLFFSMSLNIAHATLTAFKIASQRSTISLEQSHLFLRVKKDLLICPLWDQKGLLLLLQVINYQDVTAQ